MARPYSSLASRSRWLAPGCQAAWRSAIKRLARMHHLICLRVAAACVACSGLTLASEMSSLRPGWRHRNRSIAFGVCALVILVVVCAFLASRIDVTLSVLS